MGKFMQKLNLLAIVFLLIDCSSLSIEAGAKDKKGDVLVKTFEVESSDCIKGYRQSTDKNGKPTIDRLVTVNAVKQLNKDGQFVSIFDRTTDRIKVPGGDKCPDLHSFFSPDGKYFLEQITCGPECAQTRVVDMETKKSIIPKESSYPSAATDSSFVTLNIFANEARLFDYAGNEMQSLPDLFLLD